MKKYRILFTAEALSGYTQFQIVRAYACKQEGDTTVALLDERGNTVAFLYYALGIISITEEV